MTKSRLKREFKYGAFLYAWEPGWLPIPRHGVQYPEDPDILLCTLDDILGDTRNRVWLCSHHHELTTNGRLYPSLPESVWEFAREFGLVGALENDLARRSAA